MELLHKNLDIGLPFEHSLCEYNACKAWPSTRSALTSEISSLGCLFNQFLFNDLFETKHKNASKYYLLKSVLKNVGWLQIMGVGHVPIFSS